MCGIAGYMARTGRDAPVGRTILAMLRGLAKRGPDSAGVALFRSAGGDDDICWLRLPEGLAGDEAAEVVRHRLAGIADIRAIDHHAGLLRLVLGGPAAPAEVLHAIERSNEDFEVVSLGRSMELIKQVGHPDGLERSFSIAGFRGSHAIGHTRLSTESRVDLSHSQPFWARGVADVATAHNGHITNYHRLRRLYEQRGVRFFTGNDSEVIGVYIADQLERGLSLEAALEASLDDFDGSFTYLVATPDALGFARDPFALKPLITVETPDFVAIANEEVAIRAALGGAGVAHEPTGHVFRLWRRTLVAAPVAA